ncbi:MAG TPA: hypothetical protein VG537_01035 [Candidatus Kapabacteria bacterium]|jgi:hypothetical protein|nr:hypothetical protein [Candidatus Kapabacteria bacterium]
MRLVGLVAIIFLLSAQQLIAQPLIAQPLDNTSHSDNYSVGVPRYVPPPLAHYRLTFGMGLNAGHVTDAPLAYAGSAVYESGHSIFGAGFIVSANNPQQPPYNTLSEFDILYGYAFDETLARYESKPGFFHASISTGIGLETYNQRWRHFGRRGFVQDSLFLPNTLEFSPCVPVQFQAVYEPLPYVGIGSLLFLSVSKFTPSYGATVFLEARY